MEEYITMRLSWKPYVSISLVAMLLITSLMVYAGKDFYPFTKSENILATALLLSIVVVLLAVALFSYLLSYWIFKVEMTPDGISVYWFGRQFRSVTYGHIASAKIRNLLACKLLIIYGTGRKEKMMLQLTCAKMG